MTQDVTWAIVASALIYALVAALKSPRVPAPLDRIPAAARPFVALGLGVVSGALDAIARGTPWREALALGVASAAGAIVGHDTKEGAARLAHRGPATAQETPAAAPVLRAVEVTRDEERGPNTLRTGHERRDGSER